MSDLIKEVDAALANLSTAVRLTADDVYTLRLTLTKVADHLRKADTARVLSKGKSEAYAEAVIAKRPRPTDTVRKKPKAG